MKDHNQKDQERVRPDHWPAIRLTVLLLMAFAPTVLSSPALNGQTISCPCSVLGRAGLPAMIDSGDGAAVELGVKFRSDVNGLVAGIRFYKSAANTGTHVAHLWTKDGMLLASATFTDETVSGWQQVNFPSAVAVSAGTTYVASYYAPKGRYSTSLDYFEPAAMDKSPLHFLKDGEDGGNGVFAYSEGAFPTSSFRASNYWVDTVLINETVISVSPAPGSTVSKTTTISATLDVPLDPATVTGSNFRLLDYKDDLVPATVTYDSNRFTATLAPSSALDAGTVYTAHINGTTGGVTQPSSKSLGLNLAWRFTTCCSTWSSAIAPQLVDSGEAAPVELGVKFQSDEDGFISGLRFYKSLANMGIHVGRLWTKEGKLLASATFSTETRSGWQQVNFSSPVAVTAGTTYVASYSAPLGHFSVNDFQFASGVDSPPLRFLRDGVDGSNGVFQYGVRGNFPNSTFRSRNYWVDVVFEREVPARKTAVGERTGRNKVLSKSNLEN